MTASQSLRAAIPQKQLITERQWALSYLGIAVKLPSDPLTHASILRLEASVYYSLGRPSQAESDDQLASQSFNHVPDVTGEAIQYNVAYTDLWDAYYQIPVSCARARIDVSAAREIVLALLKQVASGTLDSLLVEAQNDAQQLHLHSCSGV